ncbi:hypothetical protein FRB90_012582 [Tulasnella sp. 427]|nr:hypothetical protein FRB90_012582 [Tulasnella sp. 427]
MRSSTVLFAVFAPSILFHSVLAWPKFGKKAENYKTGTFEQRRDHNDPASQTFQQQYFFNDEYYEGQGYPIIIASPGEEVATANHLILKTMMRKMMKELKAAGIILEHRYWGDSQPFQDLRTENLRYLTLDQAAEDSKYFVENVKLPWSKGKDKYDSNPSNTPWITAGCSYPGLLAAYSHLKHPDLFAAGYASCAPVTANGNFWQYWQPVMKGLPSNCSSDLSTAARVIEGILAKQDETEIKALKTQFGLEGLSTDDFAAALRYPIDEWQDMRPYTSRTRQPVPHAFCDVIQKGVEVVARGPKPLHVKPQSPLERWANAFRLKKPLEFMASFSTADAQLPKYTDHTLSSKHKDERPWKWMLCNEFGWFQVGGMSSWISSLVSPKYFKRQCGDMFRLTNGTTPAYDFEAAAERFNEGLKTQTFVGKPVIFINGEFDPWRSVSVSSESMTPSITVNPENTLLIAGGNHCWDWDEIDSGTPPQVEQAQKQAIKRIKGWLDVWYTAHPDAKTSKLKDVLQKVEDVFTFKKSKKKGDGDAEGKDEL